MNPDTGEMKEFASSDLLKELAKPENKGFVPLPKVNEILEIKGCRFAVKSYDVEKREMLLVGISRDEATQILMGSSLDKILEKRAR